MSLMPGPYQPLAVTVRQMQPSDERAQELAAGVHKVSGFIKLPTGAGEHIVPVDFPVMFFQKPSFSFGAELAPNSPIHNGRLPTVSAVVKDWKYGTRPDTGLRDYVGASFIIVTTGVPDQLLIFHYQLEGPGILVPAGTPTGAHPLLGTPFGNTSIGMGGSVWGADYIGTADFDPASVVFRIDGKPVPVDPNYASPSSYENVFFFEPETFAVGYFSTGAVIGTLLPLEIAVGPHTAFVSVTDVNGQTDSQTYTFTVPPGTGGAT